MTASLYIINSHFFIGNNSDGIWSNWWNISNVNELAQWVQGNNSVTLFI